MQTRARRVVALAFDEVELLDLAAPLEVLTVAGRRWNFRPFKIELAAPVPGLVQTRNQVRLEAPASLATTSAAEILLVPGGYGARRLLTDAAIVAELAHVGANAEIVAGVGWGVALLARAGLLGSATVAATGDVAAQLLADAPQLSVDRTRPVVATPRAVTARSTGGALDLALAIVEGTLGAKLVAMVRDDLGLAALAGPTHIEVKY